MKANFDSRNALGINVTDAPGINIAEVTVFGPGYGEAIVVHVGNGVWMVVDSAIINPVKRPFALFYLESIGVPLKTAVRKVVVSHWDDDHVKGISQVVEACESAKVLISGAIKDKRVYRRIAELNRSRFNVSSTDEISKVFDIIQKRHDDKGHTLEYASANTLLFLEGAPSNVHFVSLSPSDAEKSRCIRKCFPSTSRPPIRGLYPLPTSNSTSIVLHGKLGPHSILLGADMQTDESQELGWKAVINSWNAGALSMASFFKVAHHGDEKADHSNIWDRLLHRHPFAAVTPFSRHSLPRPSRGDLNRILAQTQNAWLTSPVQTLAVPLSRDFGHRAIKKKIVHARSTPGYVRFRIDMDDANASWTAAPFGSASLIEKSIL